MEGRILLEPAEEENEMQNPSITLVVFVQREDESEPLFHCEQRVAETADVDELAAINTALFKSESGGED